MTTAAKPEPAMTWNDIIQSHHLRDSIRRHAEAARTIYRPYYQAIPTVASSQRIADAIISDMDNRIAICDYRNASGEDLKLQASEIIRVTDMCIAHVEDPANITDADIREVIIGLNQKHARVLADQAHSIALSIMRMEHDSPTRRHMQDSAQYGLAVAGTVIKAARAIYDTHHIPVQAAA